MQKNIVLSLQVYSEQDLGIPGENLTIVILNILQQTSVWMLKLICTFPPQYFSFDKSMFSIKISLLKNLVSARWHASTSRVRHRHCLLAHVTLIQTDTMI